MATNKEILLARKNLAISREWKQIRQQLFEIIKSWSSPNSNGDVVRDMLYTIDVVDKWEDEYTKFLEKLKEKEEKGV